jgi:hypothetical protein
MLPVVALAACRWPETIGYVTVTGPERRALSGLVPPTSTVLTAWGLQEFARSNSFVSISLPTLT